jgi:predicted MPP superfamily phosphohydrolase
MSGLVWILYLVLGFAALWLVNLVWWLVTRLGPHDDYPGFRQYFLRIMVAIILAGSLAVTTFGYVKAHNPQVSPVELTFKNLPKSFDGYKVALITDIHLGATLSGDQVKDIVAKTNAANPDLIVIAGDLVDGSVAQLGAELTPLVDLKAPDGVLITTGNHEFYSGAEPWVQYLTDHGLKVLDNEGVVLERGSDSIDVLGINDRTGQPPLAADLKLAADRMSETDSNFGKTDNFEILIAHQPLQAETDDGLPAKLGIEMMLSGHTHGGQVWPIHYVVTMQQPVLSGVNQVAGMTVVTSRGSGYWGPPTRVLADPEIPVITLKSAPDIV